MIEFFLNGRQHSLAIVTFIITELNLFQAKHTIHILESRCWYSIDMVCFKILNTFTLLMVRSTCTRTWEFSPVMYVFLLIELLFACQFLWGVYSHTIIIQNVLYNKTFISHPSVNIINAQSIIKNASVWSGLKHWSKNFFIVLWSGRKFSYPK